MGRVLLFCIACALCAAAASWASGMSISDAKLLPDNSSVSLSAKAVTYTAAGFFFIEEDSRCIGIRVAKAPHGLAVGMRADVSGTMKTSTYGERYILASSAVHNGDAALAPVGISSSALGGSDWQVVGTGGQRGTSDSVGLNNIGLLISTWGNYQQVDAATFTVDDGSGLPVKCTVPSGTSLDPRWQYVTVTGISSIFKYDSSTYSPYVLAREMRVLLQRIVIQVAAGYIHSLALKSDGTVWAWGWNGFGVLGDGTNTERHTPVQVSGLTGVTAIATREYHSLALKSDGTVWAWGYNPCGQLGDGTTTIRYTPVQVSGLTGVTAIAAGWNHSLALKSDGTVWAWGSGYGFTPVQVSDLTGVTAIAAGGGHSLALKSDGTVWAWGANSRGQLGDGTTTERHAPVQVSGLTGVTAIGAGLARSLAVNTGGTVWAWGYNAHGELGDGSTAERHTPVQVSGLTGATAVTAGDEDFPVEQGHTMAVKSDGTVWAWGLNADGELGDGYTATRLTPVRAFGLTGATGIAAGGAHSLAVRSDGTVWVWGYNAQGQLGDGTTTTRYIPVQLIGL